MNSRPLSTWFVRALELGTRDRRVVGIPGDDAAGRIAAGRSVDLADPVVRLHGPGVGSVEVSHPVHVGVEAILARGVEPAHMIAVLVEERQHSVPFRSGT